MGMGNPLDMGMCSGLGHIMSMVMSMSMGMNMGMRMVKHGHG
jgi:hypothetical protein